MLYSCARFRLIDFQSVFCALRGLVLWHGIIHS